MHAADVSPLKVPIEDEVFHSRPHLIMVSLVWCILPFLASRFVPSADGHQAPSACVLGRRVSQRPVRERCCGPEEETVRSSATSF